MAKARLKRGINIIKLANRIEALRMQEDEEDEDSDVPDITRQAADMALADRPSGSSSPEPGLQVPEGQEPTRKRSNSRLAKSAIFREVVLAKVRDMKAEEDTKAMTQASSGTTTPTPTKHQ